MDALVYFGRGSVVAKLASLTLNIFVVLNVDLVEDMDELVKIAGASVVVLLATFPLNSVDVLEGVLV